MNFIDLASLCRVRQSLSLDVESIVSQEHAFDSDVTTILSRYARTGALPPGRGPGSYVDVSAVSGADYAGVLDAVSAAQAAVQVAQAAESALLQTLNSPPDNPPPVPPVPPVLP